jgi:predicted nuclease of predicted toxin-antitoxin system
MGEFFRGRHGMKLLLDENMPRNLRRELPGHDCQTVSYCGWSAKANGELLALAAEAGFDALLTKDTKLPYQQSQAALPLAVVVLKAATNKLEDVRPLIPTLLAALENLPPRRVTVVE